MSPDAVFVTALTFDLHATFGELPGGTKFSSLVTVNTCQLIWVDAERAALPALRAHLGSAGWSEITVHSSVEAAHVWSRSRLDRLRTKAEYVSGQKVMTYLHAVFDSPATMVRRDELAAGDVFWSTHSGVTTVAAVTATGEVTELCGTGPHQVERYRSALLVPRLSQALR